MAETAYLIAGCGISGKAAARLAAYLKKIYYLADENDTPELRDFAASLNPAPAGIFFGWKEGMALPCGVETVLSPGIRQGTPFRMALEQCSGKCYGELEFALQHLPCPYVGITGTNGKTTVTELTTALFKAAGKNAEAAGNIGAALSDAVIHARETGLELAVIEISSFQLESMQSFPRPQAAALLNIASDHIDRHATLDEYAAIKCRLLPSVRGRAVMNKNVLGYGERNLPSGTEYVVFTSGKTGGDFTYDGQRYIRYKRKALFDYSRMPLNGVHNCENIQAALALLVEVCGVEVLQNPAIAQVLYEFKPSAHRQEVFLNRDGVIYIDDSKATNPHAVNAALEALPADKGVYLLLGGLDKGMDFTELIPHLGHVRKIYVIGSCADRICSVLNGVTVLERYKRFEDAVFAACDDAEESGGVVILSPACASMDMFRNYQERGERFKTLVYKYVADQLKK
ncbi:MAG: UDP-N-acetylmuramoyl-L-alanine--D-glutamate ligase [Lentisphaeria bacterium]|nr:UDP-N-acetylmuramoyl-L-alanine--D-glutamate ligase [Lentisphaeria bacterium]